jgi:hypothetical protein
LPFISWGQVWRADRFWQGCHRAFFRTPVASNGLWHRLCRREHSGKSDIPDLQNKARVLASIDSASPRMLGPCDEGRNPTLTDGSNPDFYRHACDASFGRAPQTAITTCRSRRICSNRPLWQHGLIRFGWPGCFGTLKTALVHQACYKTRAAARHDLFASIEGYYNRQRLHSDLLYITPEQAERQAA